MKNVLNTTALLDKVAGATLAVIAAAIVVGLFAASNHAVAQESTPAVETVKLDTVVVTAQRIHTVKLDTIVVTAKR
jgi:hypothetical protein